MPNLFIVICFIRTNPQLLPKSTLKFWFVFFFCDFDRNKSRVVVQLHSHIPLSVSIRALSKPMSLNSPIHLKPSNLLSLEQIIFCIRPFQIKSQNPGKK